MELLLTDRLAVLSHPARMSVFRLLMRRCPDDVPAGEIAQALSLKPSTASVYLSALTSAGLITQRRNGTRLRYGVNLDAAQEVVAGLFVDCCRGRADLCPPQMSDPAGCTLAPADQKLRVLFVCTGNSARSILAETILRDMGQDRFDAYSAGTSPRSDIHPITREVLADGGHDTAHLRTRHIAEFQGPDAPEMDFVFTVCDRAANEDCPTLPGQPVSAHWGLPDPAAASGADAQMREAFRETYAALRNRIAAFTSLPLRQLAPRAVQQHVDDIARYTATQD